MTAKVYRLVGYYDAGFGSYNDTKNFEYNEFDNALNMYSEWIKNPKYYTVELLNIMCSNSK